MIGTVGWPCRRSPRFQPTVTTNPTLERENRCLPGALRLVLPREQRRCPETTRAPVVGSRGLAWLPARRLGLGRRRGKRAGGAGEKKSGELSEKFAADVVFACVKRSDGCLSGSRLRLGLPLRTRPRRELLPRPEWLPQQALRQPRCPWPVLHSQRIPMSTNRHRLPTRISSTYYFSWAFSLLEKRIRVVGNRLRGNCRDGLVRPDRWPSEPITAV
jgi:hypothetical protein